MKNLFFALVVSLSFSSPFYGHAQTASAEPENTDIIISRNCRKADKACISMELDLLDKKLITDKKPAGSETEYTIKAFGKLDREAEKEHTLKFVGGTEDKGCTAFGKGTAAILGFSSQGNPIVHTDKGNLELTSKLFRLGANNIQIVNLNSLKRDGYPSKSLDMTPAAVSRIHFDSNGDLYFLDGFECFEFRKKESFRKVELKKCESRKSEMKDISLLEKIKIGPKQTVYEIKDSSYIMIIDMTSCS